MAASSVTGLHKNGVGSAEGSNKGSERMTLGTDHLIGVRVVAAGTATLADGAATVTFPKPLESSESDYIVMLTNQSAAQAAYVNEKTDSSSKFASFTIAGNTTNEIAWAVIKLS